MFGGTYVGVCMFRRVVLQKQTLETTYMPSRRSEFEKVCSRTYVHVCAFRTVVFKVFDFFCNEACSFQNSLPVCCPHVVLTTPYLCRRKARRMGEGGPRRWMFNPMDVQSDGGFLL